VWNAAVPLGAGTMRFRVLCAIYPFVMVALANIIATAHHANGTLREAEAV
jgi:hypothetical protein